MLSCKAAEESNCTSLLHGRVRHAMAPPKRNIRDFFRPLPPMRQSDSSATESRREPPPQVKATATVVDTAPEQPDNAQVQTTSSDPSSSLPLPPPSSGRLIVKSSDDEGSDSDSSLEDLSVILRSRRPDSSFDNGKSTSSSFGIPQHSPLTVLPKPKFNLLSLMKEVQEDEATQASAKRVKALLEGNNGESTSAVSKAGDLPHDGGEEEPISMLKMVVEEREEGDFHKVLHAMKRTEAIHVGSRCYFFEAKSSTQELPRARFPKLPELEGWQENLRTEALRRQTILSGFASDMLAFGDTLPVEVLMWLIDEICYEPSESLRFGYIDVLESSPHEVAKLLQSDAIRDMFQHLGGSIQATSIDQAILPQPEDPERYHDREWDRLISVVVFLGRMAGHLAIDACTITLKLLARLCVDSIVFENVDVLESVQKAMSSIASCANDDTWEQCVCMIPLKPYVLLIFG